MSLTVTLGTLTHASSATSTDGAIGAPTVSGGSNSYVSYTWTSSTGATYMKSTTSGARYGLSAGTYTLTVTDSLGATGTQSAIILAPIAISGTVTQPSGLGGNGSIAITATGGASGTKSYVWKQGSITLPFASTLTTVNGCVPGVYSVTVSVTGGTGVWYSNTSTFTIAGVAASDGWSLTTTSMTSTTQKHTGTKSLDCTALTQAATSYPYLHIPQFNLLGSWTIEFFYYPTSTSLAGLSMVGMSNAKQADNDEFHFNGGQLVWSFTSSIGLSSKTVNLNAWNHIAVCYDSVANKVYSAINGDASSPLTVTYAPRMISPKKIMFLARDDRSSYFVKGYLDNVRVSQASLYTAASYTVPDPTTWSFGSDAATLFFDNFEYGVTITPGTVTNASAFGTSTAAISASTVTGGSGSYTYSWTSDSTNVSSATTAALSNLAAGTYNLKVTDSNGLFSVKTFYVYQPLSITASSVQHSSTGSDGSITVTITGKVGYGSDTYSWSKNGAPIANYTRDLTGLSPGAYQLTVVCGGITTVSASINVYGMITPPIATPTTSFGTSTGTLSSTSATVAGSLTYSWTNLSAGTTTISTQDGTAKTGLAAGAYSVSILSSGVPLVSYTVRVPEKLEVVSLTSSNTTGNTNNGSITFSTRGGLNTPSYAWCYTGYSIPISTLQSPATLWPGDYTCTVTSGSQTLVSSNVTITGTFPSASWLVAQPVVDSVRPYSGTKAMSAGYSNYTLSPRLYVPQLTPAKDFTVEWFYYCSSGIGVMALFDTVLSKFMTWYNSTISIDGVGVSTSAGSPTATYQHTAVSYSANTGILYFCTNGVTKSAVVGTMSICSASGLYIFPATSQAASGTGYVDSIRITQACLYTGNYTVPDPLTWSVGDSTLYLETFETLKVAPGAITNATGITPTGGFGPTTVTGGTAPYTAVWTPSSSATAFTTTSGLGGRSNLLPGTYSVVITDSASSSVTFKYLIVSPLRITATVTQPSGTLGGNGSIALASSGGLVGNKRYSWYKENTFLTQTAPITTTTLSNAASGNYKCIVTTEGDTGTIWGTQTISITLNGTTTPAGWSVNTTSQRTTTRPYSGSKSLDVRAMPQTRAAWPYVFVPELDFNSSLTIELFVYPTSAVNGLVGFANSMSDAANTEEVHLQGTNSYMMLNMTSSTINLFNTASVVANSWNHIAISYDAVAKRIYNVVNGSVVSTSYGPLIMNGSKYIAIMTRPDQASYSAGFVDAVRVSQSCLYTSAYIVPDPSSWQIGSSVKLVDLFEDTLTLTSGTVVNASTAGGSTGSIASPTITGGTAPYTYSWLKDFSTIPGATSSSLSGLSAGRYTLRAVDSTSKVGTLHHYVYQPLTLSTTISHSTKSNNGAITLTVNGLTGLTPESYSWTKDGVTFSTTSKDLVNLAPGTYQCTVTYAGGSLTSTSNNLIVCGIVPGTISYTTSDGTATGSITASTVTIPGSVATYSWASAQGEWLSTAPSTVTATTAGISNVKAGVYTLSVFSDGVLFTTYTFSVYEGLRILSLTSSSATTGVNGSISLSTSGGGPLPSYAWSFSGKTAVVSALQNPTGLPPGMYVCRITNGAMVTMTNPILVTGAATATYWSNVQPTTTTAQSYSSNSSCNLTGLATGSYPRLNIPSISYAGDWTIEVFVYMTSGSASVFQAGGQNGNLQYTRIQGSTSYIVNTLNTVASSYTSGAITTSSWQHWAMCFDASTNTLYTGTNGTIYSNAGGTLATPATLAGSPISFLVRIDGTPQASQGYIDNVRVSQQCLYKANYTVPSTSVVSGWVKGGNTLFVENFETKPTLTPGSITHATAFGTSTAAISATTISGGSGTYPTVNWTTTAASAPNLVTTSYGAQTGLPAGTYTLSVTDSSGNTVKYAYVIGQPIVVTLASTAPSSGGSNGSITPTVAGGFGSSTLGYIWTKNGSFFSNAASITSLSEGSYALALTSTVLVPTAEAYSASASLSLSSFTVSVQGEITHASSYGSATASIAAPTVSGGSAPLTYSWSSSGTGASSVANVTISSLLNVTAGTYTLRVQDATSAFLTVSYNVYQPIYATEVHTDTITGTDGSITLAVAGGTGTFEYNWQKNGAAFATSKNLTGLAPATYVCTITSSSYSATVTAVIQNALLLDVSPTTIVVSWQPVSGASSYRVEYFPLPYDGNHTVVFAPSTLTLSAYITGLTPNTSYNVNVYATVSGVRSLKYTGTTLLPGLSTTNYAKAAVGLADSANAVYDISKLKPSNSSITKAAIVQQAFSTGDKVQTKPKLNGNTVNVEAKVVRLGATIPVVRNSSVYMPFDASIDTAQTASLILSNSSTVPVEYNNANNTVIVGTTTYAVGDIFFLDGQKVTVASDS